MCFFLFFIYIQKNSFPNSTTSLFLPVWKAAQESLYREAFQDLEERVFPE